MFINYYWFELNDDISYPTSVVLSVNEDILIIKSNSNLIVVEWGSNLNKSNFCRNCSLPVAQPRRFFRCDFLSFIEEKSLLQYLSARNVFVVIGRKCNQYTHTWGELVVKPHNLCLFLLVLWLAQQHNKEGHATRHRSF